MTCFVVISLVVNGIPLVWSLFIPTVYRLIISRIYKLHNLLIFNVYPFDVLYIVSITTEGKFAINLNDINTNLVNIILHENYTIFTSTSPMYCTHADTHYYIQQLCVMYNINTNGNILNNTQLLYDISELNATMTNNSQFLKYVVTDEVYNDIRWLYILGPLSLIYVWFVLYKVIRLSMRFDLNLLKQLREPLDLELGKNIYIGYILLEQHKTNVRNFVEQHNIEIQENIRKLLNPSQLHPFAQQWFNMQDQANDIEIVLK